jgi:hypothetical protein
LPLPPPHRTLSKLEQWADLAAIHDYYGTGEKVNLWPLEQRDEPLPTNKRDRNRHLEELRKQAVGDHYWHLIEEAGRLAEGHKPFIERWLKELVADAANAPAAKPGEGNGGAGSTPLTAKPDRGETGGTKQGLRSFIVHGHDETAKLELKNYLQNRLGWPEPVILAEKRSGGKTIIEKFEEHANNIDVVFVLLTPDDLGGAVGSPSAARARQNVILELGHFTGKFGRTSGRVILLYKGDLEVPSNLAGIVYINISNGVEAAGEKIRREVATLVRIV